MVAYLPPPIKMGRPIGVHADQVRARLSLE
jgi:hypothetical protein